MSIHGERFIREYDSEDEAESAIAERMDGGNFYPDVWKLSDHGNYLNVSERFYQERPIK